MNQTDLRFQVPVRSFPMNQMILCMEILITDWCIVCIREELCVLRPLPLEAPVGKVGVLTDARGFAKPISSQLCCHEIYMIVVEKQDAISSWYTSQLSTGAAMIFLAFIFVFRWRDTSVCRLFLSSKTTYLLPLMNRTRNLWLQPQLLVPSGHCRSEVGPHFSWTIHWVTSRAALFLKNSGD